MGRLRFVLGLLLCLSACTADRGAFEASPSDIGFARESLIVDTHIDVPDRLFEDFENVAGPTERGDFDWPRAKSGGLDVAFMSIYIPAAYQETGGASEHAARLMEMMAQLAAENPDKFALAGSAVQAREAAARGQVALVFGMENGAGIGDDLAKLGDFHARGIRYITLTHSRANLISDSSYDDDRPWGGLSPFGEQVVREMNRLGIMVDVSHITDEAFYDVLSISDVPVIASHSSARHFTPGWERNMSDEMIRALSQNGGVIQINFGSTFLTAEANSWSQAYSAERDKLVEASGWDRDGPEVEAWKTRYMESNPYPFASLDDVLDHIDHVVALAGIDYVGLGSDFDGVGNSLPEGLKDVADFPNLVGGLRRRGYQDEEIRKILGENLMRVWEIVEMRGRGASASIR